MEPIPAFDQRASVGGPSSNSGDLETALVVIAEDATIREVVYRKLKHAILHGLFPPGRRLIERDLSRLMQISRTPIREALRRLEREGLVKAAPYKAPTVVEFTQEDARHLFELRAALEGAAAKLCAKRASKATVLQLEESLNHSRVATEEGDVEKLLQWNNRFHNLIAHAAANPFLEEYLANLRQRILLLRSTSLNNPVRRTRMLSEHQEILSSIARGRENAARDATERHVLAAGVSAVLEMEKWRSGDREPDASSGATRAETSPSRHATGDGGRKPRR